MSKQYYLRNKSLHGLPKSSSKAIFIQVGNGASLTSCFFTPIITIIQSQMFEIYTMASEIHDDVNFVLGFKTSIEFEEELIMTEFTFLNRTVPVFSVHKEMVKPKERRF